VREVTEMLSAWGSFYVIIGSAAATLTGLMFVVMTLVSAEDRRASKDGVSTFNTPTVVHFCYALFIAALMCAPLRSLVPLAIVLAGTGAVGVFLVARIALRTWNLTTYRADAEDWLWHVILPFFAYGTLSAGGLEMHAAASRALYAPAVAVTLLIFIGIHNAWDVVTFLAMGKAAAEPDATAEKNQER
jgi:hypothetical protein